MRSRLLILGLLATWLCACDAPIVGEWRSDKKHSNGKRNSLTVLPDLTGTATIYATSKSDLNAFIKFKFTFVWEDEVEEFDFKMKCNGDPCNGDDFTMECEVIDEGNGEVDKLDCKANKKWTDYPFDWERDEE